MFDGVPNLSRAESLRASCPLGASCFCADRAEAMERGQVGYDFDPMFGFVVVTGPSVDVTIDEFMSLVAGVAFFQMMTEDDVRIASVSAPEPARTRRQQAGDFFRGLWPSRKGPSARADAVDAELVLA